MTEEQPIPISRTDALAIVLVASLGVVVTCSLLYGLLGRWFPTGVHVVSGPIFGLGWVMAYPILRIALPMSGQRTPSFGKWVVGGAGGAMIASLIGIGLVFAGIV